MKHAGATISPATAIGSQSANAAVRLDTAQTTVLHQSSASTAWVLIRPASEGALLGLGKYTASSAGSPESNENMSGQWAHSHTDNVTWNHD
ncbi:hypothetical protein NW767_015639 [Fusarium falciforme]|nr:hypothetical protein NW767_015639 [Fusarium falciforme]